MSIVRDLLHRYRDVLERIVAADGHDGVLEVTRNLSDEELKFILHLTTTDENDNDHEWRELHRVLGGTDSELITLALSCRKSMNDAIGRDVNGENSDSFESTDQIIGIRASPYLGLTGGTTMIRFELKTARGNSVRFGEDLEDSMWIGLGILEVVANSTKSMVERFGISRDRIEWGDKFAERLVAAENTVGEIRRLFGRHPQGSDAEPKKSEGEE